jgi:adenosylmethionine-8-amino-7-oxononanoate aminotransferase
MRNLTLSDMDRHSLFHPNTSIADHLAAGPAIYTSGQGVWLRGEDGRDYLDMGAGLWCVNIGYGREELADAAQEAMRNLPFQHLFGSAASPQAIRLADHLLQLFREKANAPHMARVFFGLSGSDANDTAIKLVRYYHNITGQPLKKKIIGRIGGYHGLTLATAGLTGIPAYHAAFDVPIAGILHTACPHYYRFGLPGESEAAFTARIIQELRELILREGPETIGAFFAEPVMGTGGVMPPPAGYFAALQALLAEFDILFCVDEVITGFGRTGEWFGTGRYGLKPDIVSIAKGLTSAYLPLSATLVGTRIWNALAEASPRTGPFMHGFTYSGHPVSCAVGLATLELMEREDIVAPVAARGDYLLAALRDRLGDNPFVGDIRGVGLMAAVEFVADRDTKRDFAAPFAPHKLVSAKARNEGLLTRALPYAPATAFSPPLVITEPEIDLAVERFARAVQAAMPDLEAAARV